MPEAIQGAPDSVAQRRSSGQPGISNLPLRDFSGGLNVNDAAAEVADNEFPRAINVTLDEKGGAMARLGLSRLNSSPFAGAASSLYYSAALDLFFFQVGATLYKTTIAWTTFTTVATFTTSGVAGCVDFTGKLVVAHPVDGVFTYTGSSWALATAAVKGSVIVAWQNKVWVSGNDATVYWSNAGDATAWTTTTDFNPIRSHDDKSITAFAVGIGQNYLAKAGLLAFKEDSFYRINDSQTGAYTEMSLLAGASGPGAVIPLEGGTVFFGKNGIYTTDGLTPGATWVSQKINPFFNEKAINFSKLSKVAGGRYRDRVLFSFPWGPAQTTNNRTIELHPNDGWIVVHDFGAAAFTTYSKGSSRLLSAAPTTGYARDTFVGGTDEGAAITALLQTRWVEPESGYLCTLQRLRLVGDGTFQMAVALDFAETAGAVYQAALIGEAFVWNDPAVVWNTPTMMWGPTSYQEHTDFWDLGTCKAASFVFSATTSASQSAPALNGDGATLERGAWSIYSMLLDYVRLGLS